ncbi:GNAT family N-acetyltransferase [Kribbella sandramycini]|uniref:GNAT family N-acetyltransferase n=1 Tax=Kribbella sandramycini TaxID=60450 RepID=A0A7Y4L4B4_9ACTN|nr:GNAT family N-acetyltransferase [Kribbella sandramycini]MBB6570922.1 putative acetyltransferase [Kribbella sandramycini]NOL44053.1 GNAT family N-acetyltransferase [Kribbella sandramycini]
MTIEIRPITQAEAVEYLRVLPYVNGFPQEEPEPAAWYAGRAAWSPQRPATAAEVERYAEDLLGEGFRPQAAFVDGKIAGGSAIVAVELTLPGGRQVPMGGVTATAVLPTYRRRGLLRRIMGAMLDDCRERGEFVAGLSASEATIYGRYGFAPATFADRWEVRRTDVAFSRPHDDPGALELVDAATASAVWPVLHERARAVRVGEISPLPGKWSSLDELPADGSGRAHHLIHRDAADEVDGAAIFRLPWSPDPEYAGELQVEAFEALTYDAYRALWGLLLDFDLTKRVVAGRRPVDEPLRWMLTNSRALKLTRTRDNLWLRILDVQRALEARTYAATDTLVLEIDGQAWQLEAGPDGAVCNPTSQDADVSLTVNELGSLYLGGVPATSFQYAGRLQEHTGGAVTRLDALLRPDRAPYNAVGF